MLGYQTLRYVLGLLLVAAVLGLLAWRRRWRAGRSLALAVKHSPKSPLASLSFDDALSLDLFRAEIERYQLESLTRNLGLIPLQCVVQGISIAEQGQPMTLLCKMSETGRRAYESGQVRLLVHKGSTDLMPVLQDVDTGRTFEIMRGHAARWFKVSEVATLIVSAAHIISGMDISRKLSEANGKLDRLLRGRRNDQIAKLERVFAASKERLNEGPTAEGVRELRTYRDDLRELRGVLRRDFEDVIEGAPSPAIKPRLKFWGRKGRERKMAHHITSELSYVALLYVAFLLDVCLAGATGMTRLFVTHTLPDELAALDRIGIRLANKAELLTKNKDGLREAQQALSSLNAMLCGIAGKRPTVSAELATR